ncbi:MAG: hypothetical protein LAT63_01935 [Marinobacter sp.]|nr:hypothetical protein [Marinobacter sp.]
MRNGLVVRLVMVAGLVVTLAGCYVESGEWRESRTPLVLDSRGFGQYPSAIRAFGDFDIAGAEYQELQQIQLLLTDILDAAEHQSGYGGFCSEAAGTVVVREQQGIGYERVIYEFMGCLADTRDFGVIRLYGDYRVTLRSGSAVGSTAITERFDIYGSVVASGAPLALVGSQELRASEGGHGSASGSLQVAALEFVVDQHYVALRDMHYAVSDSGGVRQSSLRGDLVSSALAGFVRYSTPTPLRFTHSGGCPTSGHLRLRADGTLDARYGASSARGYGLELLLNGSAVRYQTHCESQIFNW